MAGRSNGHDRDQQGSGERQSKDRAENEGREREGEILRARLDRLTGALAAQDRDGRELSATGQGQGGTGSPPVALGSVLSLAFRVLSEFVAAVIVGALIGWGIDHLAGTSPAFIIVFLLMGAAAGFWNVYRIGTGKSVSGSR